jgi:hypothetical protein
VTAWASLTVVTQTIFLEVLQYCNHQPHFFAHLFKTIWPFYHYLTLVPIYLPSLLIIQFSPVNTKGIQFDSDDSWNLDIQTEMKFVCVWTRQYGDRTSWGKFRLFCTRPCQPTWQISFSVNESVKFLIRQ